MKVEGKKTLFNSSLCNKGLGNGNFYCGTQIPEDSALFHDVSVGIAGEFIFNLFPMTITN